MSDYFPLVQDDLLRQLDAEDWTLSVEDAEHARFERDIPGSQLRQSVRLSLLEWGDVQADVALFEGLCCHAQRSINAPVTNLSSLLHVAMQQAGRQTSA